MGTTPWSVEAGTSWWQGTEAHSNYFMEKGICFSLTEGWAWEPSGAQAVLMAGSSCLFLTHWFCFFCNFGWLMLGHIVACWICHELSVLVQMPLVSQPGEGEGHTAVAPGNEVWWLAMEIRRVCKHSEAWLACCWGLDGDLGGLPI